MCIQINPKLTKAYALFFFFSFVCVFVRMNVDAPCICSARVGQKRLSNNLKLESQVVENLHVGAGERFGSST